MLREPSYSGEGTSHRGSLQGAPTHRPCGPQDKPYMGSTRLAPMISRSTHVLERALRIGGGQGPHPGLAGCWVYALERCR